MRRTVAQIALALTVSLLLAPASAQALSRGFFGIVPQTSLSGEDTAPRQQLIAQVVEGPAGIYQLVLNGDDQQSMLVPQRSIFAIAVSGDTESGWADNRGQTIAVGSTS